MKGVGVAKKGTQPKGKRDGQLIDERLAKAIGHPLRVAILVECDRAPISPIEYIRRHGGGLSDVAYHFRKLEKLDCLKIVKEVPRRGANEHIYAVTKRALLTDEDFAQMPANIKGGFNTSIVKTFADRAQEAIEAGSMDRFVDHQHLTWTPLTLDKAGFDRVMEKLGEVFTFIGVEQLAAEARLGKSGEAPIHTTAGLFGFESPAPVRDHTP